MTPIKRINADIIREDQSNQRHPRSIPSNWSLVKLGDVCETTSGGTPSRGKKKYYEGNITWIKSGELNFSTIFSSAESISKEALANSSAKIFPKGTLLIALYGATVGRLAFLGIDAATNQAVAAIFTPQSLNNKFLYWFLFGYRNTLLKDRIGGAQPNISQGTLKNILIPLPPLPVQHKIAGKIEELFSELDSGVANLRKAKEQIKIYRQSVLAYAFSGKLTKNGKRKTEIFDDPLLVRQMPKLAAEPFVEYKANYIPPGWKWVKLGEIIQPSKERFEPKENTRHKFIGLEHIGKDSGKIIEYSFSDETVSTKSIFRKGDLLYGKLRPYLNKVTVAEFDGVCSTDILVFLNDKNRSNQFLKYRFLSKDFVRYAQSNISGVHHPRVSFSVLSNFKILFPPLSEQRKIVSEIERRFSVADKLEQTIDESLEKAKQLKQSILKQAFEGKLIKEEKELTPFQLMQIVGAIIKNLESYNIHKGETIIAKYLYLLQKLYKIKIGLKYERWHFGPYTPRLKKLLTSPQGFFQKIGKENESYYSLKKKEQLFKYHNKIVNDVNEQFPKLIQLFLKFKDPKLRNDKIELLATVGKVIEDFQTIHPEDVYQKLKEWNTDKEITGYSNKAEKFTKEETSRCIEFIQKNGWDRILLQQTIIQ